MTGKHQIVVSAENNAYMGWQCKLFYYSCVTRMNHQPIIIVHDSGSDWHPDFYELAKTGCAVHSAPNYRTSAGGDDLPGRNCPGSLIKAAEICDRQPEFIALCDPDMIFVRATDFLDRLSGDFSSFMDYDRDYIEEARLKLGIEREELDAKKEKLTVAVPYVVPTALASEFGRTWLQAIDAFPPRKPEEDPRLSRPPGRPVKRRHVIMYAFGLTVVKLGLEIEVTHLTDHNYWPEEQVRAPMIHYAYGHELWDKRHYWINEGTSGVWQPPEDEPRGTILGELFAQLREAREFYRDVYFPDPGEPRILS